MSQGGIFRQKTGPFWREEKSYEESNIDCEQHTAQMCPEGLVVCCLSELSDANWSQWTTQHSRQWWEVATVLISSACNALCSISWAQSGSALDSRCNTTTEKAGTEEVREKLRHTFKMLSPIFLRRISPLRNFSQGALYISLSRTLLVSPALLYCILEVRVWLPFSLTVRVAGESGTRCGGWLPRPISGDLPRNCFFPLYLCLPRCHNPSQ